MMQGRWATVGLHGLATAALEEPVLSGGERLYTLVNRPPGPWTLGVYAWTGEDGDAGP